MTRTKPEESRRCYVCDVLEAEHIGDDHRFRTADEHDPATGGLKTDAKRREDGSAEPTSPGGSGTPPATSERRAGPAAPARPLRMDAPPELRYPTPVEAHADAAGLS